jgi:hypothetical protein
VLKPRAVAALGEDLVLIDRVLAYLESHADVYDIGDTPLVDIFHEIREALSREVQVSDERKNLIRAREYYGNVPGILVPAVLPFSTENVTCMEFVEGVKVTDAFPKSPPDREKLARRLSDALTYDVVFSPKTRRSSTETRTRETSSTRLPKSTRTASRFSTGASPPSSAWTIGRNWRSSCSVSI